MNEDRKLAPEWGADTALELWNGVLDHFDVEWNRARVLDVGASWGYLLRHLLDQRGIASAVGVDPRAPWRRLGDQSLIGDLTLHEGEVDTVEELQDARFDVIVSTGTLMLLTPTRQLETLHWMRDHLEPGGHCVIATRTYLSHYGADQQQHLSSPLPHLVFGAPAIDALLARRGAAPLRYMNPSCAATYLMLFRRAGFDIVDVRRTSNIALEAARERFPERLVFFNDQELETSELHVHLRRPAGPADLSGLAVPE